MTEQSRLPIFDMTDLPPDVAQAIEGWPLHLHRTIAHSPDTLKAWMTFAKQIARHNALPLRDREIVVLRVAWNAQSDYEWRRHHRIATQAGLTEREIRAVTVGAGDPCWNMSEAGLLEAVDQLMARQVIDEPCWANLAAHYNPQQLVDLVMLVGEFVLVAMVIGAMRTPHDDNIAGIPSLADYIV